MSWTEIWNLIHESIAELLGLDEEPEDSIDV